MSASSSSSSSPLPTSSDVSQQIQIRIETMERLLTERRASEQEVRVRALRALDAGTQTERSIGTQTETGTNCGDDACTAPYS